MRKKYNGILTPKEEELMNLFWDNGKLFVREIVELYPDPKPHFNTLSTFVRGLEDKGYVEHEEFGNSYRYFAAISRDEFHNESLKGLIGKYFNNSVMSAVSSLVAEEEISLEDLKKLISEVENSKKK